MLYSGRKSPVRAAAILKLQICFVAPKRAYSRYCAEASCRLKMQGAYLPILIRLLSGRGYPWYLKGLCVFTFSRLQTARAYSIDTTPSSARLWEDVPKISNILPFFLVSSRPDDERARATAAEAGNNGLSCVSLVRRFKMEQARATRRRVTFIAQSLRSLPGAGTRIRPLDRVRQGAPVHHVRARGVMARPSSVTSAMATGYQVATNVAPSFRQAIV